MSKITSIILFILIEVILLPVTLLGVTLLTIELIVKYRVWWIRAGC